MINFQNEYKNKTLKVNLNRLLLIISFFLLLLLFLPFVLKGTLFQQLKYTKSNLVQQNSMAIDTTANVIRLPDNQTKVKTAFSQMTIPNPTESSLAAIETWVDQIALDQRDQYLRDAFGTSNQAQELARMLVLSHQVEQISSEQLDQVLVQLQNFYSADFKNNAEQSIQAIEKGMYQLSSEDYPLEKSALIETLNLLPGGKELALKFSYEEMSQPHTIQTQSKDEYLSTSEPHFLLALAAHQFYIDNSSGFDQANEGTSSALKNITDKRLQLAYLKQLEQKYPTSKM